MKKENPGLLGHLIVKVEILVYDEDEVLSSSAVVRPAEVVQGLENCARTVLGLWKGDDTEEQPTEDMESDYEEGGRE